MKIIKASLILLVCLTILSIFVSCNTKTEDNPYNKIIEKYNELLHQKVNDATLPAPDDSSDEIDVLLYDIVNSCTEPAIMGYATKDINGDGLDELVLMNKNNKLYALFTQKSSSPILLLEMGSPAAISPDGTIYSNTYIQNKGDCTIVKKIASDKLEGLEFGGAIEGESVSYYKIENGVRAEITAEEKNYLDESVRYTLQSSTYVTKTCGFRFIPSNSENSPQNTAPVADFSTYDAILSAYKTIVGKFSEYTQQKWVQGEFEGLYTFEDNKNYEVFHNIFYHGIMAKPTKTNFGFDYAENGNNAYGYCKIDLNADGVEELILMTNDYDIISIFTMKNGKAVLLSDLAGGWIDEKGQIYIEKSTGGIVSRDGEAYLYEIKDGDLNCIIAVGYKVNLYLEKEGWYKIENGSKIDISKEEGESLYSKFDVMPNGYMQNEYIRNVTELAFVPIFEKTKAESSHINTFTNSYFVSGSSVTISSVSDKSVTFSFECVKIIGDFNPNDEQEIHKTTISGNAVLKGDRYEFDIDGVKGYIDFSVNSVWVIITESQNEHVESRAYLLNYHENI